MQLPVLEFSHYGNSHTEQCLVTCMGSGKSHSLITGLLIFCRSVGSGLTEIKTVNHEHASEVVPQHMPLPFQGTMALTLL